MAHSEKQNSYLGPPRPPPPSRHPRRAPPSQPAPYTGSSSSQRGVPATTENLPSYNEAIPTYNEATAHQNEKAGIGRRHSFNCSVPSLNHLHVSQQAYFDANIEANRRSSYLETGYGTETNDNNHNIGYAAIPYTPTGYYHASSQYDNAPVSPLPAQQMPPPQMPQQQMPPTQGRHGRSKSSGGINPEDRAGTSNDTRRSSYVPSPSCLTPPQQAYRSKSEGRVPLAHVQRRKSAEFMPQWDPKHIYPLQVSPLIQASGIFPPTVDLIAYVSKVQDTQKKIHSKQEKELNKQLKALNKNFLSKSSKFKTIKNTKMIFDQVQGLWLNPDKPDKRVKDKEAKLLDESAALNAETVAKYRELTFKAYDNMYHREVRIYQDFHAVEIKEMRKHESDETSRMYASHKREQEALKQKIEKKRKGLLYSLNQKSIENNIKMLREEMDHNHENNYKRQKKLEESRAAKLPKHHNQNMNSLANTFTSFKEVSWRLDQTPPTH